MIIRISLNIIFLANKRLKTATNIDLLHLFHHKVTRQSTKTFSLIPLQKPSATNGK